MKPPFHLLSVTLMVLFLSGCNFTKSKQSATKAVDAFHTQFNEGRFGTIYSEATPSLRTTTPEADFLRFIQTTRDRLGVFQRGTEVGWRTDASTNGTFVYLTYKSEFERGKATEAFTFVISGESATLQSYHIDAHTGTSGSVSATQTPAARFASSEEAQREAVRRYPLLGVAGSPLNQDFLARHKRYQREHPELLRDPAWPVRLAEESARAVKTQ